jgi:hypothetical protein
MSKIQWDHEVLNSSGKIVFFGPFEACIAYFRAAKGYAHGWTIKKVEEKCGR